MTELSTKRGELFAKMEALANRAANWTEEEQTQFAAYETELENLDQRIAKVTKFSAAASVPTSAPLPGSHTLGSRIEVGQDLEATRPFRSFGEQLSAIRTASIPGGSIDKRLLLAASGSNTVVDSEGGYAVQQDFAGELMTRAIETDEIASRCTRLSVNGDGLKFYRAKNNTDANNAVFGGIRVYRAAQAATVEASKPELEPAELRLAKLMGIWYATDELLSDASALEGMARIGFSTAMSMKLSDEILNGTGTGECLGLLNSAAGATIEVAKEAGQAAATIVYPNVRKMRHRILASANANAIWLVNGDAEEQLEQMTMPIGTGGVPVFLPPGGLSEDGLSRLYGRAVVPSAHCPALGTKGDIIFTDLSRYLLIDKAGQGVKEDVSMHVRFLYGENTYRWTWRINGMPIDGAPFDPKNSTNTRSAAVTLAARA